MSDVIKKNIIEGGTWLFLSEIIDKSLAPIMAFLFARIFGSEILGQYSFILSFVSLTFILSDLGTTMHAIRKCAGDSQNLQTYFSHALGIRILFTFFSIAITLIAIYFMNKSEQVVLGLLIYVISIAVANIQNSFEIIFYSLNNLKVISLGRIIERITLFLLGVYSILVIKSFIFFMIVHLISQIIHFLFIYINSKKFVRVTAKFDFFVWREFILRGITLALTSFFYFTYFKIDVIMLSFMLNDSVVGAYSASYKLLELFLFFPYVLSYSVFPSIFEFYKTDRSISNQIFSKSSKLLIMLSIPIVLGVFSFAPEIINLIYGADFTQSILPLRIIILALPFIFLHQLFRFILYSLNEERRYLLILVVLSLFNIITNYFFIRSFGFVAAAWTTVASEFIGFILMYRIIKKEGFGLEFKKYHKSSLKIILFSILLFFLVFSFLQYKLAVIFIIIVYLIMVFLIELNLDDRLVLFSTIKEIFAGILKKIKHQIY